jgi:hypothetical protein
MAAGFQGVANWRVGFLVEGAVTEEEGGNSTTLKTVTRKFQIKNSSAAEGENSPQKVAMNLIPCRFFKREFLIFLSLCFYIP